MIEVERMIGMRYAFELLDMCDELWVCDSIVSAGMKAEIEYAQKTGKEVRYMDTTIFMEKSS
jgi:hypothetical protein